MRSTYTSRCSSPIPEMIVCPLSASTATRNVGSSFWKRFSALLNAAPASRDLGATARDMTGSGTRIDVIATFTDPSVKVSPDAHSTPKSAPISPGPIESTSSMSSECIRTSLGTFTRFPLLVLTMFPPLRSVPW